MQYIEHVKWQKVKLVQKLTPYHIPNGVSEVLRNILKKNKIISNYKS